MKKILAFGLALVLCLVGLSVIIAEAEEAAEVSYQIDNSGEWTQSSLMDAVFAVTAATTNAEIRLNRDINLTDDSWTYAPAFGKSNVSFLIDGNGHKIQDCRSSTKKSQVLCFAYGEFTLKNIVIDGGAVWSSEDADTRTNSGLSSNMNAHLIVVGSTDYTDSATVILEEGAILQNNELTGNGSYGGAVYIWNGSLIMKEGAVIQNNAVGTSGAAVQVDSTSIFQMEGGEIKGNYAGNNGVVCTSDNYSSGGGTFEMSGGSITGNKAGLGGAGVSIFNGTGNLSGGQITDNVLAGGSLGAGVLVYNGTLTVSGSPTVTNNTKADGTANNVYLNGSKVILIDGTLSGGKIGVTVHSNRAPQEGAPSVFTNSPADKKFFSSDNLDYMVTNADSGEAQLSQRVECTITFNAGEGVENPAPQQTTKGTLSELPSVTRSGYIFDGWYTAETGGEKVSTDTVFDEAATLYARWLKNCTATFNTQGGSAIDSQTVTSGATLAKPADPSRIGYTFQGWYTDAACTAAYDFSSPVTGSLTLYAKWQQNSTPSGPNTPSVPSTPSLPVTTGTTTQGGMTTTASPTASTQGGTATSTVSGAIGAEIVKQAVAGGSGNVVIAPQITGSVTKTEVTIPASTVGQIGQQTNASLTVSTPVAAVTIPNGGLGSLSGAGGSVTVTAQQDGAAVELSVTAGGQTVESIPGGLTLTVPSSSAASGTVAVLVHSDGIREVVRKSVAGSGSVTIPLDGPAKLEIVDNSKPFADVPAASWAADAVAFASAHELFQGTAPNQFSPTLPMSRGMLAVVLHNLESNPAHALSSVFADVADGTWYAEGIAWAADNHIVDGYGNGRFGPGDNITREQLAVMLWRYVGKPSAAANQLNFADAGQASDWALDALRWAVEKGVISGKGDGNLDPGGYASRAETAQMLKNFMEKA